MPGPPAAPRLPRVLFIDDDELVGRAVGRLLKGAADLVVVPDATRARALLAAGAFDVVVCDLALPDGNGVSLLEEAGRLCPDARRVLFSALEPPSVLRRALEEERVAAVLAKPEGLADLVALVRGWEPGGEPA